jgi:pyruvate,water dikinase
MQPQLEAAMRAQYAQLHYTLDPDRPLIRRFWGRGYFNLSLLHEAGAALFGATAEDQAAQLGGALVPHVAPTAAPTLRQRLYWVGNMLRFGSLANRARGEAPACFTAIQQQWQADVQRIPHLHRAALLEHIADYKTTAWSALLLHLNLTWAMSGNFSYLRKMLRSLLPDTEAGLVADLVTGLGDVSSADHGYQLWTLSRLARQSQQVMAFLEHKAWDTWQEALAGTPFLEAWQHFLATFGHRALYEIEMANPRWREQPDYLFAVLAAYVRLPQDAAPFAPAEQARRRQAAERDVLRRLAPWRRFWFRLLLRRTQEFSRLRENSKSHLVQQIDLGRLMALRAGQLLAADGALPTPEAVFFLEHSEIIAALRGELPPEVTQRLATQRQLGRQRDAARQPPELIIGERPVYGETLAAQGTQLSGLPSNPGRVTGIARVLRSPHEGARLQPGEILVAPSTDPGWTPLFLLAAGLVMETGGYLSHGAIVAREYGIPAVLNVPMATQRIPDGTTITLDGGQGVVQLLG